MKKHIPNVITLCNLACGLYGLVLIQKGDIVMASIMIGPALIFDFLDGFMARILKVSSHIGKELDSLADMVTFGVLPGFIMFALITQSACDPNVCTGLLGSSYFPFIAAAIPLMSAMRLAKFNVDARQSDLFIGLPTPANSIFIASLPLIALYQPHWFEHIAHPKILGGLTFIMSYLLVAEIPLLALKFKTFAVKGNGFRYTLILGSVLFLVFFKWIGLPIVILYYILLSIINNVVNKS